ncbi:MAG: hypothetical protein J7M19_04600 [Planctomycetes bacterium]|nr:hypothetical protein [Planctomycetota bacterium]
MQEEAKELRLGELTADVRVAEAITHGNLALVPLESDDGCGLDYVLGAQAIEEGLLTVTEVNEGGSVPELSVTSTAEVMILLLDGEELVGAKQNRILNTTVLLPAKAKTRIPVSCVEAGRWHYRSPHFKAGAYAPANLRASKVRSVTRNLRATGRAKSDQGEVWDEVAESMQMSGVYSDTGSMHDMIDQRRESLDEYLRALAYPENARGIMAAIGGKFAVMDLFDKPETLRKVWERLITGYAIDAMNRAKAKEKASGFGTQDAEGILEGLSDIECEPHASAGVGRDWRFEAEEFVGQALVVEGCCAHLCAFPNTGNESQGSRPGPRIEPPSRRRRRQR